jgi:hypothetical protein
MGSLNGRVGRLEDRLGGRCVRCSGVVLVSSPDGERMNGRQWQEYGAGCPVCGHVPPAIQIVYEEPED